MPSTDNVFEPSVCFSLLSFQFKLLVCYWICQVETTKLGRFVVETLHCRQYIYIISADSDSVFLSFWGLTTRYVGKKGHWGLTTRYVGKIACMLLNMPCSETTDSVALHCGRILVETVWRYVSEQSNILLDHSDIPFLIKCWSELFWFSVMCACIQASKHGHFKQNHCGQ
jgi:hypothetical protein